MRHQSTQTQTRSDIIAVTRTTFTPPQYRHTPKTSRYFKFSLNFKQLEERTQSGGRANPTRSTRPPIRHAHKKAPTSLRHTTKPPLAGVRETSQQHPREGEKNRKLCGSQIRRKQSERTQSHHRAARDRTPRNQRPYSDHQRTWSAVRAGYPS